ncbi:intein C-terminal splicing region [Chryseobacterium oleae]|uniref:Intein C-terminal splicing region n=2 Tax=Chryseobacterium oleae TaxID=491207 RepID=A0A1I5CYN1_CHROL|nr:intein C-terminal splicing region [Chryseobacterium oleae]
MLLTTLDGKTSPVEFIKFLDEKVKVYNFEVEGNHNYYVSEKGILVHNDCAWPFLEKVSVKVLQNASCDADALAIQKVVGGDIMTVSNPMKGLQLGPVKYGSEEVSGWFYHKAVKVGDVVFDRITGPSGMHINDYKALFEYGDDLIFK